jgi:NADH:ubiquinone oxidoreductase subunit 4 (subunit M)
MTRVACAKMGFPGTSSFIGEFLILVGMSQQNIVSFMLGGLGLLFSTIYNVWYLNRLVFGVGKNYEYSDLTKKEVVLVLFLIIIIISLGLFPSIILENL